MVNLQSGWWWWLPKHFKLQSYCSYTLTLCKPIFPFSFLIYIAKEEEEKFQSSRRQKETFTQHFQAHMQVLSFLSATFLRLPHLCWGFARNEFIWGFFFCSSFRHSLIVKVLPFKVGILNLIFSALLVLWCSSKSSHLDSLSV